MKTLILLHKEYLEYANIVFARLWFEAARKSLKSNCKPVSKTSILSEMNASKNAVINLFSNVGPKWFLQDSNENGALKTDAECA